ncbi:hypothetical protein [Paenibacillus pinistramenti]|uniref:hypothetical protein n=1 Tax=Paenibacillus pinistramenti TaxID=1768003 RepID=UPI0011098C5E|nr:hypothetical protein [Paenibacillus pinistramenti]
MQIFAAFEYSEFVELAISELEARGITGIYAVPLNSRPKDHPLVKESQQEMISTYFEKGMVLAFMFSTIGASKGFVWPGGPVIWGLAGAGAGFLCGVLLNLVLQLLKRKKSKTGKSGQREKTGFRPARQEEVILIVNCEESQIPLVENILWLHKALGVAATK